MAAARKSGGGRRSKTRQAMRHAPKRKPVDKQSMYVKIVIGAMVVLAAVLILLPPNLGRPVVYKIETGKGDIVLHVYPSVVPETAANFEKLVTQGYYDGLTFHRVEDWVVQGGDNESGGPGWTIPLETTRKLKHYRGAVGMARLPGDPDSASAQFYIVKEDSHALDGDYAVFGKVVDGMEVVDQLEAGDEMVSVTRLDETTP